MNNVELYLSILQKKTIPTIFFLQYILSISRENLNKDLLNGKSNALFYQLWFCIKHMRLILSLDLLRLVYYSFLWVFKSKTVYNTNSFLKSSSDTSFGISFSSFQWPKWKALVQRVQNSSCLLGSGMNEYSLSDERFSLMGQYIYANDLQSDMIRFVLQKSKRL